MTDPDELKEVLGFHTPYSLMEVLKHLHEAGKHLMQEHGCDTDGYEIWQHAIELAPKYVEILEEYIKSVQDKRRPVRIFHGYLDKETKTYGVLLQRSFPVLGGTEICMYELQRRYSTSNGIHTEYMTEQDVNDFFEQMKLAGMPAERMS